MYEASTFIVQSRLKKIKLNILSASSKLNLTREKLNKIYIGALSSRCLL